jgi:hypothetical protein
MRGRGQTVRLPVSLGRRLAEPADQDLATFYARLLKAVNCELFRGGEWQLCDRSGWPDNQTCQNILAWCWIKGDERCLIVINWGPDAAQVRVRVPWDELRGRQWKLTDALSGDSYDRSGDEMRDVGMYVDLGPWNCHVFLVSASTTLFGGALEGRAVPVGSDPERWSSTGVAESSSRV